MTVLQVTWIRSQVFFINSNISEVLSLQKFIYKNDICEQAAAMREEWKTVRENAYTGGQVDLESDVDNTADLQVCMIVSIA